jgi:integrase
MVKAREGIDPRVHRRQAAEQAKLGKIPAVTFAKLAERYRDEYCEKNTKASTTTETVRLLSKAAAFFGDKPVGEITEADVAALLKRPSDPARWGRNGGLSSQNNTLKALRRCFAWAKQNINPDTGKRYIDSDPAAEVMKPLKNEPTRDRVLEDPEIIAFWRGCEALGWPFGPLFELLLVTGQRREEVAGLRWSELDLAAKVWHLPGSRTKNSRPHDVHLSALALSIIDELPVIKPLAGKPDFVFSTRGDTSVSGFAFAKAKIMPGVDWRLHDLRRTATTGLARLGVAPHVADRVLNHQSGTISGVAAVYNRFSYLEERKEALEKWGGFLSGLTAAQRAAA